MNILNFVAISVLFALIQNASCDCPEGFVQSGECCDECGIAFAEPNARIVGGQDATPLSLPSYCLLVFGEKKRSDICSANIINRDTLLTTASCIHGRAPESVDVYCGLNSVVGIFDCGVLESTARKYQVKTLIPFPTYIQNGSLNNIGIIKLTEKITFSRAQQPICLPEQCCPPDLYPSISERAFAAGWGVLRFNTTCYVDNLQIVDVQLFENSECSNYEPNDFDPIKQICAGDLAGEKDACTDDGGGSLIVEDFIAGRNRQVSAGIINFGFECANADFPGIYTRTCSYRTWIDRYM